MYACMVCIHTINMNLCLFLVISPPYIPICMHVCMYGMHTYYKHELMPVFGHLSNLHTYMYVCMYVCIYGMHTYSKHELMPVFDHLPTLHTYMCACMYVCICMHACMYALMPVICMHVCMYELMPVFGHLPTQWLHSHTTVPWPAHMYVHIHV